MKKEVGIGPRISEASAKWLESNFETRNGGASFVLEAFPPLYRRTLQSALARLTDGEKKLIIDLHNAYAMTRQILGQVVILQVSDGIELEGMDKKWGVDKKHLLDTLHSMHPFDLACIEIWATAFWQAGHWDAPDAIEKYIKI